MARKSNPYVKQVLGTIWKKKWTGELLDNYRFFYVLHPENQVVYNIKTRYVQEYLKRLRQKRQHFPQLARGEVYPETKKILEKIMKDFEKQLNSMYHFGCAICGEKFAASYVGYKIFEPSLYKPAAMRLIVYTDFLNDGIKEIIKHLESKHRNYLEKHKVTARKAATITLHRILGEYTELNYELNEFKNQIIVDRPNRKKGLQLMFTEEKELEAINQESYIDEEVKNRIENKLYGEKTKEAEDQPLCLANGTGKKMLISKLHDAYANIIESLKELPKRAVCREHKVVMEDLEEILNHLVEEHPYIRPSKENVAYLWHALGDWRAVADLHHRYVARVDEYYIAIEEDDLENSYVLVYPQPMHKNKGYRNQYAKDTYFTRGKEAQEVFHSELADREIVTIFSTEDIKS
jgi:hypothetical protein